MSNLRTLSSVAEMHERHARDPEFANSLSHRVWVANRATEEVEIGARSADAYATAQAEDEFQRSLLTTQVAETAMGTILDEEPENNLAYLEQLAADEAKRDLAISVGQGLAANEEEAARMDDIILARQNLQAIHASSQPVQNEAWRQN